jgi:hypothetical protein
MRHRRCDKQTPREFREKPRMPDPDGRCDGGAGQYRVGGTPLQKLAQGAPQRGVRGIIS